jgi:hypothetical protein
MGPAVGVAVTVMGQPAVTRPQPVETVYNTLSVPAAVPVTIPPDDTVAMPEPEVLQVPPDGVPDSVKVPPMQVIVEPETLGAGEANTEI